jgi:hypothetical protein
MMRQCSKCAGFVDARFLFASFLLLVPAGMTDWAGDGRNDAIDDLPAPPAWRADRPVGMRAADDLPPGISSNWLSEAQRNIAAWEYHVTEQPLAGAPEGKAFHAPNRAQNLRTWFLDEGIRIEPRDKRGPAERARRGSRGLGGSLAPSRGDGVHSVHSVHVVHREAGP